MFQFVYSKGLILEGYSLNLSYNEHDSQLSWVFESMLKSRSVDGPALQAHSSNTVLPAIVDGSDYQAHGKSYGDVTSKLHLQQTALKITTLDSAHANRIEPSHL